MKIQLYEEWMKPQVARLFAMQYEMDEAEVAENMEQFYEHPFQKDKCIRLVALEGEIVIGFQSLFYWPYQKDGVIYNSFQSGNSLVHPGYRGKGIFQKLLLFLDEYNKNLKIDFLMGFPVQMSYGSFMKNKWKNPLNIVWKVKIINPFAFLCNINKIPFGFDKDPKSFNAIVPAGTFRLVRNDAFINWINASRDRDKYCYFHYEESGNLVRFNLKINKRNRWINELIIGDISTNSFDPVFIKKATRKLIRSCRRRLGVSLLTIALNELAPTPIAAVLKSLGFKNTDKAIYFIIKDYTNMPEVEQPGCWVLYRSDIDTW